MRPCPRGAPRPSPRRCRDRHRPTRATCRASPVIITTLMPRRCNSSTAAFGLGAHRVLQRQRTDDLRRLVRADPDEVQHGRARAAPNQRPSQGCPSRAHEAAQVHPSRRSRPPPSPRRHGRSSTGNPTRSERSSGRRRQPRSPSPPGARCRPRRHRRCAAPGPRRCRPRHDAGHERPASVNVPVLSNNTASTLRIRSRASLSLTSTPLLAATAVDSETTSGIASPARAGRRSPAPSRSARLHRRGRRAATRRRTWRRRRRLRRRRARRRTGRPGPALGSWRPAPRRRGVGCLPAQYRRRPSRPGRGSQSRSRPSRRSPDPRGLGDRTGLAGHHRLVELGCRHRRSRRRRVPGIPTVRGRCRRREGRRPASCVSCRPA